MNFESEIPLRETGPNLAISIGTALAIEVIGGHAEGRDPEPESRNLPEEVWVSIRTLIRNLYSGQDKRVKEGVLPHEFLPTLEDEMRLIKEYIRDTTGDKVKTVFFACLYNKDLRKQFPHAILKEPSTPGQKAYVSIENQIVEHYYAADDNELEITIFKGKLEPTFKHVWLLTSASPDLLEIPKFKKGLLLESHTGKLKNSLQLTSKLTGGNKLTNIPFNKLTLQVFGDKSTLFSPMPKAVKDSIKKLADENRWTPATSVSNVKFAINAMNDKLGARYLLKLLS